MIVVYHRGGAGAVAFIAGARASGLKIVEHRFSPAHHRVGATVNPRATAVVLEALHGPGRTIRENYQAAGTPVWIVELPRLRAGRVGRVGPHGSATHGFYLDTLHYLSPVPGNTAVVAGVIQNRSAEYILVAGQKPNDTAHGMNYDQSAKWARRTIAECRERYQRPVCYRPHPQAVAWHMPEDHFGADSVSRPSFETIREALAKAAAIATYNSTAGVDAIDAGVPVFFTADEREVAYHEYAAKLGDEPRILTNAERETCLMRFAACQWTIEQLQAGVTARCLFAGEAWPTPTIVTLNDEEQSADAAAKKHSAAQQEKKPPRSNVTLPKRGARWLKGRA